MDDPLQRGTGNEREPGNESFEENELFFNVQFRCTSQLKTLGIGGCEVVWVEM
jgi:hypothetical protein